MSTPKLSLVEWTYKLILQEPPAKYEEGMVLSPSPFIPLADLTELVEGLRKARGVINSSMLDLASLNDGSAPLEHVRVMRDLDKLLTQFEAHRKEG